MPLCNGLPDRAPHIFGFCFILCYRCTFACIGVFSGLTAFKIFRLKRIRNLKVLYKAAIIAALALPLIADGLLQTFTDYQSTNALRALTGFLFGVAAAFFADSVFHKKSAETS